MVADTAWARLLALESPARFLGILRPCETRCQLPQNIELEDSKMCIMARFGVGNEDSSVALSPPW